MSSEPPVGARGDQVLTGVIPLEVNGDDVQVSVAVIWEPAPSRVPLVAGAVIAGFALMIALSAGARIAWVLAVTGAAAAGIGWWPGHLGTAGDWSVGDLLAAPGSRRRRGGRRRDARSLTRLPRPRRPLRSAARLWAFLRRDGLVKALLPTGAPFWLDRGVTAAAAVVGLAGIAAGALGMLRLPAVEV